MSSTDRIARSKDANTVEKLKAGCDERYEAVGFGTSDALVPVPATVAEPIPDVEGFLTWLVSKTGMAEVVSSNTGPWATECCFRCFVKDLGDIPDVRDPLSQTLVRLVGVQVPPENRGRRKCTADRIELISP